MQANCVLDVVPPSPSIALHGMSGEDGFLDVAAQPHAMSIDIRWSPGASTSERQVFSSWERVCRHASKARGPDGRSLGMGAPHLLCCAERRSRRAEISADQFRMYPKQKDTELVDTTIFGR